MDGGLRIDKTPRSNQRETERENDRPTDCKEGREGTGMDLKSAYWTSLPPSSLADKAF
jgi:hypothetical protein